MLKIKTIKVSFQFNLVFSIFAICAKYGANGDPLAPMATSMTNTMSMTQRRGANNAFHSHSHLHH